MELDFSRKWSIIAASAEEGGPESFAAAELAETLGRMGCRPPVLGDEGDTERIIILSSGSGADSSGGFSWRAAPDRAEIYGSDGSRLLRGVYDFLGALGARWPAPGVRGERLPQGPILDLEAPSRSSRREALRAVLALGRGAFLERYADYLLWAARAGYSSALVRLSTTSLPLEGCPAGLYESLRPGIAGLARRLGLDLELGGDFARLCGEGMAEEAGETALPELFAEYAAGHPEVSAFHLWPDSSWNLEGRDFAGRDAAPSGERLAQALRLGAALRNRRPGARLFLHAQESDSDLAEAVLGSAGLGGLGLQWSPRRRSWGRPIGAPGSALNAASLSRFRSAADAWRRRGGGEILVLERYEDAFLFKGAVPPLPALMKADLASYRGEDEGGQTSTPSSQETPTEGVPGADAIGLLCGGSPRLGLRPNPAILAALAADPGADGGDTLAGWARAAYGGIADVMLAYWRDIEAAWSIDLDLEEGESEERSPKTLSLAVAAPPSDWGDPCLAGAERLAARRDRCEELFDHLRGAEARLAEARASAGDDGGRDLASAEAEEYAISGSVLELDCARLSAYCERAAGDPRAAADIANLALSAAAALGKALSRLPDPRDSREARLVAYLFYELPLREIRRFNARSALRRLIDLWASKARLSLAVGRAAGAYEPKGGGRAAIGGDLARRGRGH